MATLFYGLGGCSKKVTKIEPITIPVSKTSEIKPTENGATLEWSEQKQIPTFKPIYFDFDRSEIKEVENAKLFNLTSFLAENPGQSVTIIGHCDERGSELYNLNLGQARADAVKNWLINAGIKNGIVTASRGEEPLINTNCNNDPCHSKNRRAEIKVQ